MTIHLTHYPSVEDLTRATVDLLARHFNQSIEHPFAIMLSGGKTPLEVYRRVAQNPLSASDRLHLLWSDERVVPHNSPDSNYGNTQELISALRIPAARLLAIRPDLPLEKVARDYHSQIQAFLDKGGNLPLGLLGLGTDGHTASLFSLEDARGGRGAWAIPVRRLNPPDRVSVTSDLLSRFEHLVFLVTGPEKREILRRLEEQPETIPAGVAVRGVARVDVWCCLGQG